MHKTTDEAAKRPGDPRFLSPGPHEPDPNPGDTPGPGIMPPVPPAPRPGDPPPSPRPVPGGPTQPPVAPPSPPTMDFD
jgi:hypothetical protein